MSENLMNLCLVKTKTEFFLSDLPSWETSLKDYLINGEEVSVSFNPKWVCVKGEPTKIERWVWQPDINHRFELIDQSFLSEKVPATFLREEVLYKYDGDWVWKDEFSHLKSLYKSVSDPQPKTLEPVPFKITKTVYFDEIREMNGFSYPVQRSQWSQDGFIDLTDKQVTYELIDSLVNPDIVLPMRPAHLTSKQSYGIIRKYVQDNIDPKYAHITSDYNFCFTVKKKIPCDPIPYQVDLNAWSRRKKRPKYETRFRNSRDVTVFEMTNSDDSYKGYTAIPAFKGENIEDLKENIDNFLSSLIKEINKPLVDCSHCKGMGVILEGEVK